MAKYQTMAIDYRQDVYTTSEIARILGCSPRTVGKMIDLQQLKGYRLPLGGKHRRVTRKELTRFIRENGMAHYERFEDEEARTSGLDSESPATAPPNPTRPAG